MMTRKDFVLIAAALSDARGTAVTPSKLENDTIHEIYVSALADRLAEANPHFDRERFVFAARGG